MRSIEYVCSVPFRPQICRCNRIRELDCVMPQAAVYASVPISGGSVLSFMVLKFLLTTGSVAASLQSIATKLITSGSQTMKTNRVFKPAMLSFAVAAALQPGFSYSQTSDDQIMEEVVVVGTRGALMRAQAQKMDETSIVEALSAEDIGKLPDTSIAESLARLPGLAGERVNGRTSGISVRGFKEDFVGTSLNGREVIGIGDNRGIEYDLYPSEIMTGATIHKSASGT